MTLPRFYAPALDPSRAETILSADESHHLVRVMRLGSGDEIAIFDGHGHEFRARVIRADRHGAAVAIIEELATPREPRVPTLLVQAVLKGDKMDGVVRDATMAGAARVVPIVTERSLVRLSALGRAHARERWERVAVASAKQCRRARLPAIDPPQAFADWLATPFDGRRLLLAEPASDTPGVVSMREALGGPVPRTVACLVGPEGGWSPVECEAGVAAGCVLASLGQMTLRADAAGLVAVSLVSFAFDDR